MRLVRRYVDVVLVAVIAVALVFAVARVEQRRTDTARRDYHSLTQVAAEQMDTWLANHLAFQRSLAFVGPDADDLEVALAPGYVSFALLLDGDGRVLATYPSRPDIVPGTDLSGRFSHIDDVLAGASQGFWASDAATTASGSAAATAVSGPGQPPTVLTFAWDANETALARMLASLLDTVGGARWSITDVGTAIPVLGAPVTGPNQRTFPSSDPSAGWRLDIVAPTSSIEALVGGTTDWTARLGAASLVAVLVLAVIIRRRVVAEAGRRGIEGELVVFEAASTPSLLLDPASATIIRANDAMAALVGVLNPRQLDGSDIGAVLVDDSSDPSTADVSSDAIDLTRLVAGEAQQVEQRYWMQGEQRWGRVSARRLHRPDAEPVVLVEIHDLDQHRQREALLERQRVALEDMAGRVSHDLRTPITAMIGFAELLQRSPDASAADRAEWLDRLAANARRLGEHVRDMAEVAVEIADHPLTDVRACVSRAIKLHDTAIHAAGADVVNLVDDGMSVAMPELLLRQVIANLIDNAVKYRDRARPLEVRVDAVRDDEGTVEIRVADNGPGIAPERREQVFTAGRRIGAAGSGSGLGLALCRTLVEDFGGTLGVTDNEPIGARFFVWLPQTTTPWPTDAVPARPSPASSDEPSVDRPTVFDHFPVTVLVLGDDRELVDANRVALAQYGWARDDLPADTWIDHLPDDGVRSVVLDALFTGRTEAWLSATGDHAGLVMTLDGDPGGRGALVLSWPASSATPDALVHDELTGLPDRAVVRDRLVRALRDDAGSARSTAVLTVDIDGFRSFNERRGLSAGDQVLQAVADRLRASAIDEDSVARQGADEFVIVRPGIVGRDEALRVAERIRAHLGAPITLADGIVVSVTCSVGVAVAGRDHDPDLLLIAAAQALHEARRADRPTAVVEVS